MQAASFVVLAGVMFSPQLRSDDGQGDAKKWLTGRWAPVPMPTAATAAAEKQSGADANPKGKVKAKIKTKGKRAAAKRAAEVLPKLVIEFTKDGKIRLDGNPSTLGEKLRFIKPLAIFPMKVAPENKHLKISYQFMSDDTIEVSADYTWLMEKLSAGGSEIPPEMAKELDREFRPREKLRVAATSKELKLTDEQGKSLTFRRYTGESLDVAEGKQKEAELRAGLKPFEAILKQQGINIGGPAEAKPAPKSQPQP
jgi:hypothetical protein